MITVRDVILIVNENREFQGINITVFDSKLRKQIRLETYNDEVRYNLQDIAVMCGLQKITNINDYVIAGRDFRLNRTNRYRKRTPEKKLITQKTVIDFLKDNSLLKFVDFIYRAKEQYDLYLQLKLNSENKLDILKKNHAETQKRYWERNKDKEEFKKRHAETQKKYWERNKDKEEFKKRHAETQMRYWKRKKQLREA